MNRRWVRRLAALLLLAGLAVGLAGAWIPAKAWLAQRLLHRAWAATLAGQGDVAPWPWADTFPVARLRAPRLGAESLVLADSSGRTLAFGPGHVAGTAAPGSDGHCVLGGHRDTSFGFLRHLRSGDLLELETADGAVHRYRVEGSRVVDHRQTEVLEDSGAPRLTLITCFPFETVVPGGPLRYVVTSRRA